MENKGRPCIMVGYNPDHPNGTYRMLDLKTRKVILSRDVRWIGKNYRKWRQTRKELESDSEEESEEDNVMEDYKNVEKLDTNNV